MNRRSLKAEEFVKREVGKLIARNISFSRDVLVTITNVNVSSDMNYADIFITVFPSEKFSEVENILDDNIYNLQRGLNKKFSTKHFPRIKFKLDKSGEYVEKIFKIINKNKLKTQNEK